MGQHFPYPTTFLTIMHKFLKGYTVKVKPEVVKAQAEDIVVQFHQFPGTSSVVAHASLYGFELAVVSSPCVDPRQFSAAIGQHYGEMRARTEAENKLWEMQGIELLNDLNNHTGSDEDFVRKFGSKYVFTKLKDPEPYRSASITPLVTRTDLTYKLIGDMKKVKVMAPEGTYVFDRQTLLEIESERVGMPPNFNIKHHVETYLREAEITS